MCKPWVTHSHKKTGNKLERSLVPFHIRSQMTQMRRCYSKCVCVLLERHCSWPPLNRPRLPNYFRDSWFRVSSLAIILLGIWSWFYYSFGFLFCLNSLVNLVLYTFRMTEFKALSLVLRCRPLLRFSLLTIFNIYYAWSPLSRRRGFLRGLRQMLKKTKILTAHVQKIKEISLHFLHNLFSEMPFKGSKSNKKYSQLDPRINTYL